MKSFEHGILSRRAGCVLLRIRAVYGLAYHRQRHEDQEGTGGGAIHGEFSVRGLQDRCPHVGIDLIRRILREQRQAKAMEYLGRGPDARWRNI